MKVLAVLFLVSVILAGCVNLPIPPLEFIMYCDVCEKLTSWQDASPYFECSVSGTRW